MPPWPPLATALVLPSLTHTQAFGRRLGELVQAGDVLTLAGDLGAGKTTLTQAIGQGLAVPATCYITSPTFSLLHEYPGRLPLYHLDLYRLHDAEEVSELGFEDYLYGEGVSVVEWPDRLGESMPEDRLQIELIFRGESGRLARLQAHGPVWRERWQALLAAVAPPSSGG